MVKKVFLLTALLLFLNLGFSSASEMYWFKINEGGTSYFNDSFTPVNAFKYKEGTGAWKTDGKVYTNTFDSLKSGAYQYIDFIDPDSYNTGLCITFWVNATSVATNAGDYSLAVGETGSWGNVYFRINQTYEVAFRFGCGLSSCDHQDTGKILTAKTWYFIAMCHNATKDFIYVNNELIHIANSGTLTNNDNDWGLFADSAFTYHAGDKIQDLRFFNYSLSHNEILWLYNYSHYCSIINYPNSCFTDYNITTIYDNSSYHYVLYNTTAQLKFTGLQTDGTAINWSNALTLNISALSINQSFSNGVIQNVFINSTATYFDAFVYNTLNISQNNTFRFYIISEAEYLSLIYNNTQILIDNTEIIISNLSLISNYSAQILNLTNETYNEVNFIKKLQICFLKQYESFAEYNYYCADWRPFNLWRPEDIKTSDEIALNITGSLIESTLDETDAQSYQSLIASCYNFNASAYLYLTNYKILNLILLDARMTIENIYCFTKMALKMASVVKEI